MSAPRGWKPANVRIAITDTSLSGKGFKIVAGYECAGVPGLVVTPERHNENEWVVTHRASGYIVNFGGSLRTTCRVAERMVGLTDWTQSRTALLSEGGLREKLRESRAHPTEKTR